MNIFVLNTGRCGSVTFARACQHITNYSSAHESRSGIVGPSHFDYPENHIEIDNRLSWFLGRLDKNYGKKTFYVHLKREKNATAKSFSKRYHSGIINAYRTEILMGLPGNSDPLEVSLDYCKTVNDNIEHFLADKTNKMSFSLETGKEDFRIFWEQINAEGNLEAALAEFTVSHNASKQSIFAKSGNQFMRAAKKVFRLFRGLPTFIRTI